MQWTLTRHATIYKNSFYLWRSQPDAFTAWCVHGPLSPGSGSVLGLGLGLLYMWTPWTWCGYIGSWTQQAEDTLGHEHIGLWTCQVLDTSGCGHSRPWTHWIVDKAIMLPSMHSCRLEQPGWQHSLSRDSWEIQIFSAVSCLTVKKKKRKFSPCFLLAIIQEWLLWTYHLKIKIKKIQINNNKTCWWIQCRGCTLLWHITMDSSACCLLYWPVSGRRKDKPIWPSGSVLEW